jgi:hypothetical protein
MGRGDFFKKITISSHLVFANYKDSYGISGKGAIEYKYINASGKKQYQSTTS